MTIKERKEREREEMRSLILTAASEIMKTEGIDSLSIRKIATRIEYSPAIIYHYFQDKDDIVSHLMREGYQRIVDALSSIPPSSDEPAEKLKELTRRYIGAALQMSDEYMAVQLNNTPAVLEYTAWLFKGASNKKSALQILFLYLKNIFSGNAMDDTSIELTAQIMATATFGLVVKLIIENNIPEEQRTALIEHHIKCIIDGMILGKPLNS